MPPFRALVSICKTKEQYTLKLNTCLNMASHCTSLRWTKFNCWKLSLAVEGKIVIVNKRSKKGYILSSWRVYVRWCHTLGSTVSLSLTLCCPNCLEYSGAHQPLKATRWKDRRTKGDEPRRIYGLTNDVLLVSKVYVCDQTPDYCSWSSYFVTSERSIAFSIRLVSQIKSYGRNAQVYYFSCKCRVNDQWNSNSLATDNVWCLWFTKRSFYLWV